MPDVTFHLEVFDGPLDLLLHLLSKNKIEIKDIPIAEILEQYLEYLEAMQRMDIELTGDFIAMAAQLVYIKSRMLLPVHDDEETDDPRAELVEALLDYQRVKMAGQLLLSRYKTAGDVFVRQREIMAPDEDQLYGNTLEQLFHAMAAVLENAAKKLPPTVEALEGIVNVEKMPVSDVMDMISSRFELSRRLSFIELISVAHDRSEMVAVFLAVLELSRLDRIDIIEDEKEGYCLIDKGDANGRQ